MSLEQEKPEYSKPKLPIPDMVLSPEERATLAGAGKPKLPGVPEKLHESALIASVLGIKLPALGEVGQDLEKLKEISQKEKQRILIREKFLKFYKDPGSMEEYFDVLRLLQETGSDYTENAKLFSDIFSEQFEKMLARVESYSPEILKKWLELSVKSPLYKEMAEKVLRTLFTNTRTVDQTLNLMYAFALGTLETGDPKVFQRGVEILNYGTDIIPLDSEQHKNFRIGIFGNDEQLKKQMEIDGVKTHYGLRLMPELYHKSIEVIAGTSKADEEVAMATRNMGDERLKKLTKFFYSFGPINEKNLGGIEIPTEHTREWPYTLIYRPGPLRVKLNKRIAQEEQGLTNLYLPTVGNVVFRSKNQETINKTILSELSQPPLNSNAILEQDHLACIFYLSPDITPGQRFNLSQENIRVRKHVTKERVHSVSPRGDKMLVVDEGLKQLAIKSFTFELSEPKTVLRVTVEVGNFNFVLQLNSDLNLEEYNTGKPLDISFEQRAFLEHVILSHLKELQCTDRIKLGATETKGTKDELERQQEFTDRRGHRRLLPLGQQYSRDALKSAWDEQGWDLAKMNAGAGKIKETGMFTYVKIQEAIKIGGKPLISRAPHAMDVFHSLVKQEQES